MIDMTKSLKGKSPSESSVEMRMLVMPNDANPHGTIFGGVVMSWVDMAAAMVAQRHCGKNVVTAHIDNISFKASIKIGQHVKILSQVNYTGNTSLEIGVKVFSENPKSGKSVHTTTAYLTFVALDEKGSPTKILPIIPKTGEDKRRYKEAEIRVNTRKKNLKK